MTTRDAPLPPDVLTHSESPGHTARATHHMTRRAHTHTHTHTPGRAGGPQSERAQALSLLDAPRSTLKTARATLSHVSRALTPSSGAPRLALATQHHPSRHVTSAAVNSLARDAPHRGTPLLYGTRRYDSGARVSALALGRPLPLPN